MQKKSAVQSQAVKPFTWCVSSTRTVLTHASGLQSARDGSDTGGGCGCGSNISPLPAANKMPKLSFAEHADNKKAAY